MSTHAQATDPDPDSSLRARLVAVRRQHILDAATRVFAAKGFDRATIRDVARRAGVADGTIYNYFPNKAALLLGILDRLNETAQRRAHLGGSAGADPETFLRAYLQHRLAVFAQVGFDAFQVLLSELLVNAEVREAYQRQVLDPTFALAETAVREWLDRGAQRDRGDPGDPGTIPAHDPAHDPALAARVLAGTVLGVLLLRLLGDPVVATRWGELPAVLTEAVVRGVLPRATSGEEDGRATEQRP
jgi:AcrR family transcriptional regulator